MNRSPIDAITEILNAGQKLPPAVMLVETPLNADTAIVRDELGRHRYTVVHPHYLDGGDIICKAAVGGSFFNVSNAASRITSVGTGGKVICTSRNDDSVGETVADSTGSPAAGDWITCILTNSACDMQLRNWEMRYGVVNNANRGIVHLIGVDTVEMSAQTVARNGVFCPSSFEDYNNGLDVGELYIG